VLHLVLDRLTLDQAPKARVRDREVVHEGVSAVIATGEAKPAPKPRVPRRILRRVV
jgi:hypothetical protein